MKIALLLIPAVVSAVSACAEDAVDRMIGTWKYNPQQSHDETTTAGQWTFEKTGPYSWRHVSDQTLKSGEKRHTVTTQICDGAEHHNEGRPAGVTSICDPKTLSFVAKTDGKIGMEVKTEFSPDGRTVTYHRKLLNQEGKWVEDVRVWDKQ